MSHITTSAHRGRANFDALPQSLSSNSNEVGEGYGEQNGHHDNQSRENDYPSYDGRHYGAVSDEDVRPNKNGPNLYSVHTRNVSQLSGDTEIPLSYEKTQGGRPPMLDHDRPNYKPSALRWPFLTSLLVILLALIGLMIYALHALPVLDADMGVLSRSLHMNGFKRAVDTAASEPPSDDAGGAGATITATPAQTDHGEIGTITVTSLPSSAEVPGQDNYGDVGSTTVTESETIPMTGTETNYGDVGKVTVTLPTMASSKASGDFGDVGKVTVTEVDPTYSKPEEDFGNVGTATITENHDNGGGVTVKTTVATPPTPTFVAPAVVTLTDSQGSQTAISTSTPTPVSTPRTTTLTDPAGRPTATQVTAALVEPSVIVETDAAGSATATVTNYPVLPPSSSDDSQEGAVVTTFYISYGQYFIGMFLPSIITIALSVPFRVLDLNARIFQPWHELTHDRGAAGRDSLCLQTGGWQAAATSVRSLAGGQALVFLTTLLALASALLVPLSAEAVAFDVRGGCARGSGAGRGCAFVLSVFAQAAWAAVGLLAAMALATLALAAVLARWRSGLSTNPWSVCGAASLAGNADVRRLLAALPADEDAVAEALRDRRFGLGYFPNPDGATWGYGVVLHDDIGGARVLPQSDDDDDDGDGDSNRDDDHETRSRHRADDSAKETKNHLPFLMLGYTGRLLLLFVLCGLLALILYYSNTGGDTPFERFMDSESFGVRFLFTGVGVVISFFWSAFFDSVAILSPYHLLASSPQTAQRSILLAPPTNAFSGLWSSIRRRHGFLAVVALTSILSEFLTVFLSNVPYRVTQTFLIHTICRWCSVGIICIMILVVAGSFFVRWPRRMPLDPSTIAGAIYYVCDSRMLDSFGGLSTLDRKERDRRVNEMGLRYEFGEMRGVSGKERVGVDSLGDRTYTI